MVKCEDPAASETADPLGHCRDAVAQALRLPDVLPGVVAIAVVGSWARGAARADSDLDLVVLTEQPSVALCTSDWIAVFGDEVDVGCAPLTSEPSRNAGSGCPTGLVIEVGIAEPSWAATDPLDAGTERVVRDGVVPLHDPHGLLNALLDTTHRQ